MEFNRARPVLSGIDRKREMVSHSWSLPSVMTGVCQVNRKKTNLLTAEETMTLIIITGEY